MTAKDVIRQSLEGTRRVLTLLLNDLSDADLLVRPVSGANHIAWQLGHLIVSEHRFLSSLPGVTPPVLPEGFAERHSAPAALLDPLQGFLRKSEYLELFDKVRAASLDAVDRIPEADLDRPNTGPTAPIAPTLGALFSLTSSYTMLHSGQFSVVHRALGKPNLL
jgi:hypothetical protein